MATAIMQPGLQQPDFGLMPTDSNMQPLAATGLRGSGAQLDAPMEDLSLHADEVPVQGRGLSLGFLKGKKSSKDGAGPKKRGPKRDAKPAVSRRQELNRQAQRTHRERKEYYTKSLELEVSRMRESYTEIVRERQKWQRHAEQLERDGMGALRLENDRLKQLLQGSGIAFEHLLAGNSLVMSPTIYEEGEPGRVLQQAPVLTSATHYPTANSSHNGSISAPSTSASQSDIHPAYRQNSITTVASSATSPMLQREFSCENEQSPTCYTAAQTPSTVGNHEYHARSGSVAAASSYPPSSMGSPLLNGHSHSALHSQLSTPAPCQHHQHHCIDAVIAQSGLTEAEALDMDHDQLGVDFVLALEENCRDHQQFLNLRANPPKATQISYELSGHAMMLTNPPPSHIDTKPDVPYHQAPSIPLNNLMELLETAQRLPLTGGEITPVLALRLIREDKRYRYLTRNQFVYLTNRLKNTSRCYGFGAVLEEYEVRDAIDVAFEQYGNDSVDPQSMVSS